MADVSVRARPATTGAILVHAVAFLLCQSPARLIANFAPEMIGFALLAQAAGAFLWTVGYRGRRLGQPRDLATTLLVIAAMNVVLKVLWVVPAAPPYGRADHLLLSVGLWAGVSGVGVVAGLLADTGGTPEGAASGGGQPSEPRKTAPSPVEDPEETDPYDDRRKTIRVDDGPE